MKTFVRHNIIGIILVILGLNFVLTGYAIYKVQGNNKIYTIGVNRLTDSFTKGLNNTSMSREQQSLLLINFAKGLDSSLSEFRTNGKVLMMEEAVLSGGIDITEQVVAKIKKGMGKND